MSICDGDLVIVNGPVQYYSSGDKAIISSDTLRGKKALVTNTRVFGDLAEIKLDNKKYLIHPSHLNQDIKSEEMEWISVGAIVKITGPISTRQVNSWYLNNSYPFTLSAPGSNCTEKYANKLAEVIGVKQRGYWRGTKDTYLELKIKGSRGGTYYAVAWPSSVEPVFSA